MKKDRGVYDKVCGYINPYLSKDMNVLELACGSGQLSFNLSKYTKKTRHKVTHSFSLPPNKFAQICLSLCKFNLL